MSPTASLIQPDDRGLQLRCPACNRPNRLPYDRLGREFRCAHCKAGLPAPSVPVEIPDASRFASLISRCALPVLVDFWAPWCGPCKMVAPELVKVAGLGAGRWLVTKVNTEEVPELAAQFGIQSIPTLVLFRDGREVRRQSGAAPASVILQFLQQNL